MALVEKPPARDELDADNPTLRAIVARLYRNLSGQLSGVACELESVCAAPWQLVPVIARLHTLKREVDFLRKEVAVFKPPPVETDDPFA